MSDTVNAPARKPTIRRICGAAIDPYVDELSRLRVELLREFPYLYERTLEDETAGIQHYADCLQSVIALALVDDNVVGASNGMPLANEANAVQAPFIAAGHDPARVFYGGESVLIAAYRSSGVYRQFFLQREAYARELGSFDTIAFCAIERPAGHRLRPRDYAPLDAAWARYGYVKRPELVATFAWKDVDEQAETQKTLVFWLKTLPPSVSSGR